MLDVLVRTNKPKRTRKTSKPTDAGFNSGLPIVLAHPAATWNGPQRARRTGAGRAAKGRGTMSIDSFVQPGAFGPETIAAMSEALEAACEELGDTGRPEAVREIVALRIIAAARLGECDPVRLREAALRKPD